MKNSPRSVHRQILEKAKDLLQPLPNLAIIETLYIKEIPILQPLYSFGNFYYGMKENHF